MPPDIMELLAIVSIGFVLGMRHATDADHVVAVTTVVSNEGRIWRSAIVGAVWGVGHTITILLVGSAIILFRIALPARIGLSMELAVGIMLVLLGLRNLGLLWRRPQASCVRAAHAHDHDPSGVRVHQPAPLARKLWFYARPLGIGLVHGLAGSAAVALLVLSTISNPRWACAYLGVFGLGTVLGMMLITLAIGTTFTLGRKRFSNVGRHFGFAAGAASFLFGLFISYQIGFVNGLFTSHVHWTPR